MSLGGRPPEEGGHKPINLSLDDETYRGLKKIRDKGEFRSKFIENAIRPLIRQLDPGNSCTVLDHIDETLKSEISSALSRKDFEMASALAILGNSLEPYRNLCHDASESGVIEFRKCPVKFDESSEDTRQCMIEFSRKKK